MRKNNKVLNMVFCALFAALIAVGAKINIPIPVVPFTLQFLFTTMAGLLLGPYLGASACAVYTAIGLIGLPVFANGGGIAYVFQPSFGYMIGFIFGAFVTGLIANKTNKPGLVRLLIACFSGLLIVYAVGMIYYYLIKDLYLHDPIGVKALFYYCFLLAVPGDIVICILSSYLGKRLIPVIGRANPKHSEGRK